MSPLEPTKNSDIYEIMSPLEPTKNSDIYEIMSPLQSKECTHTTSDDTLNKSTTQQSGNDELKLESSQLLSEININPLQAGNGDLNIQT